jgi:cytochrome c oxidase subunit IV
MTSTEGQQHPLGIYFKIWILLFVLSAFFFMMLKAGLIVAVFMHMIWERLALVYAIIVPPLLLLVFVGIGTLEGDHTYLTRMIFFGGAE